MEENYMDSFEKIPMSKILAACSKAREMFPDRDDDEILITFEFLIGSFFPEVINNIKESFTRAYAEGYNDGMTMGRAQEISKKKI